MVGIECATLYSCTNDAIGLGGRSYTAAVHVQWYYRPPCRACMENGPSTLRFVVRRRLFHHGRPDCGR